MSIVLTEVSFKNFFSYGNNWTTFNLNTVNTTLITGTNGSGKSTFMDAICYGLFDKAYRKVNKAQVINALNRASAEIKLTFTKDDDEYIVQRKITKSSSSMDIYKNGSLIDKPSTNKDYQNMLEQEILGMDYDTFSNIDILGSTNYTPFMELTAKGRRDMIEGILNLTIFSDMSDLCKKKINTLSAEVNNKGYEIQLCDSKIQGCESTINSMKELDIDMASLKSEYDSITKDNEVLENEKGSLNETLEKYNDGMKKLQERRENGRQYELNNAQLKAESNNIVRKAKSVELDECPSCKQIITEDHKHSIKSVCDEELASVNSKIDKNNEYLNTTHKKTLDTIEKGSIKIRDVQSNINSINTKISVNTNKLNNIRDQVKEAKKKDDTIKDQQATIEKESSKKTLITTELDKVNEDLMYYKYISGVLKDNGLKASIVSEYIPIFNNAVLKYLTILNFNIYIEFDENFNVTIKHPQYSGFSFANFSEGQKQRINLAILFAFREIAKLKYSHKTNVLIMDEVMDGSLDASGVENFKELISTCLNDVNVFIISHNVELIDTKFDNRIVIERVGNYSNIAE